MKKSEQFFLWLYARYSRTILFWCALGIASYSALIFTGYHPIVSLFVLTIFLVEFLFSLRYGKLARTADDFNVKLQELEQCLQHPKLKGVALSGLWDLCVNNAKSTSSFVMSRAFTYDYQERFLAVIEKIKEGPAIYFNGVRSLDFAEAIGTLHANVSQMSDSVRLHQHVVFLEKLSEVHRFVIDTYIKPQHEFFIDHSKVDTYLDYADSLLFRYNEEVLSTDEHNALIFEYFNKMTGKEVFALFEKVLKENTLAGGPDQKWSPYLLAYLGQTDPFFQEVALKK